MEQAEARRLALELMRQHGLLPEWTFGFDHAKLRFGKCNYTKKEITLSRHLVRLNDAREVRETILHEIAHALAPRGAGHNGAWRAIARKIGCSPRRCYGAEVNRPRPKYRGTCPTCQQVIYRHRRARISCGRCSSRFDARHAFVWVEAHEA